MPDQTLVMYLQAMLSRDPTPGMGPAAGAAPCGLCSSVSILTLHEDASGFCRSGMKIKGEDACRVPNRVLSMWNQSRVSVPSNIMEWEEKKKQKQT